MYPSLRHPFVSDLVFASLGPARRMLRFRKRQMIFAVGDHSDSMFFIDKGAVKLTVCSPEGKEAVTAILDGKQFFGEEALAGRHFPRSTNAVALTGVQLTHIERDDMLRLLFTNKELLSSFLSTLVELIKHLNEELADSLLYNSEQRLVRALLSVAELDEGDDVQRLPPISQQDLASMIGTSRQRVNVLMQRFKKLGLVDYSHGCASRPPFAGSKKRVENYRKGKRKLAHSMTGFR
jgi:CRP/FNR family transcriptional regulator, cyclic AMP receptor protein